jgi:hypothetical protein
MYAVYVDPSGDHDPQYELYDMKRDPDQMANLVDRDSGQVLSGRDQELREHMHSVLIREMQRCGTTLPVEPAGGGR